MALTQRSAAAIALGVILGALIVSVSVCIVYFCCCCGVVVDSRVYSVSDLRFEVDQKRKRMFIQRVFRHSKQRITDSEDQRCSNSDSVVKPESLSDLIESFNKYTEGLLAPTVPASGSTGSKQGIDRMSNIQCLENRPSQFATFVAKPTESQQLYISSKYDSFSRTLMLQNLLQDSLNDSQSAIRKVSDPFSDSPISIGGIVVVIKPFHGKSEFEFKSLQTGDLLRVVKFYIRDVDDIPNIDLQTLKKVEEVEESPSEATNYETANADLFLGKDSPHYEKLYCTGIILNTFLEFQNNDFSLRIKEPDSTNESEMLKDFPLGVVSLETTLLRQLIQVGDTDSSYHQTSSGSCSGSGSCC